MAQTSNLIQLPENLKKARKMRLGANDKTFLIVGRKVFCGKVVSEFRELSGAQFVVFRRDRR